MSTTPDSPTNGLRALLARAASEPQLRARLLRDPLGTLRAEGFTVPDGVQLRVVENTAAAVHLVLPPEQVEQVELADETLDAIAGAGPRNSHYS